MPAGVRRGPGVNQYDLGLFNEATVIEVIRKAGRISRTEIAMRTGLTQQSVSRILRALLDRGLLVEESAERSNQLGKPRTPVRLRAEAGHAVGVLVDPEVVSIVLADLEGAVLRRRSLPLSASFGPDDLVRTIVDETRRLVREAGVEETFLGVGVAVPGPITADGTLLDLPLKASWRGVALRSRLEQELECTVVVEKDGAAAAIGEQWVGGAARSVDFAYVYVGTGIGSGLVLGGQVYRGETSNAGEFGQLVAVRTGQVDDDGPRLVRECNPTAAVPEIAVELGYTGDTSYAAVCAASATNEAAAGAVRQVARIVSEGVVSVVDLLDISLVVLGGPAFHPAIRDTFRDAVERAVNLYPTAHETRTVVVEESRLGEEAASVGAASTIFHAAFAPRMWGTHRVGTQA